MIDIDIIRKDPQRLDEALKKRGAEPQAEELAKLDVARRAPLAKLQQLQAQRNDLSRQVGELKKKGENADAPMAEVAALKVEMDRLAVEEADLGAQLDLRLASLPNIPADDVPVGSDEHGNSEVKKWTPAHGKLEDGFDQDDLARRIGVGNGQRTRAIVQPRTAYWPEEGARIAQSRFTFLMNSMARLERAIANFMLDLHTTEHGYTEVSPPLLVNAAAMYGTGNLPKFEEDLFKTTDGLYLIPTAEVPLTNLAADYVFDTMDFEGKPTRLTALTPCFRSEAGSAGRDTKGILRQHQFYKVELVSICLAEESKEEHERMVACAETVLERLELPYRRMLLCTGDMGFGSQKTYDLEVWLPGQKTYREISSCSNCGDFQARRMMARHKRADEKSTQFLHTLNGSGVAVGRCLIAVMENYQQPDGSILIPAALRPYMNGLERIELEK